MNPTNALLDNYYIGVDVGTGSARAAILTPKGDIVASATHDTKTWRSHRDSSIFEQSTADIWGKIAACVKEALHQSNVPPHQVMGVGFTATCSLAVVDMDGKSISVSEDEEIGGKGERNIILWADHRAEEEANLINSTGSEVLKFVGGTMSLEMEIPKILWLKKHMPADTFARCQFFDLPDYLTYRATGSPARSNCSLVCKTSYVPPGATEASNGFDRSFLSQIGLGEFAEDTTRIGGTSNSTDSPTTNGIVLTAGLPVGRGLTKDAASDLGLMEGTPVGSGVIDAYAGWIGTIAARYRAGEAENAELSGHPSIQESTQRLAAVAGTSTCHLAQSIDGVFVPGVWGPYKNAVFPGWWMNEGGQSATGQLIEFVISSHPACAALQEKARQESTNVYSVLEAELQRLRKEASRDGFEESLTGLTKDIHLYPDFHGNRSPLADPKMRGSITGLALDSSLADLALRFNVTLEAIALQTRQIVDQMNSHGHNIKSIYMSGSQAKNIFLMQLIADVCSLPVILPHSPSAAVVVGAAMLGRFAAEVTGIHAKEVAGEDLFQNQSKVDEVSRSEKERLWEIMVEMTQAGRKIEPGANPRDKRLLEAKYQIFLESIKTQRRWREIMEQASNMN
ncbi:hypothetical protein M407DRAFT_221921 [Tulasnella calospora MUT 4182]|uniref:Carbohydrate kinase FGGY C-terminal domain-containing protein n=1 Tax=Tulasnella calospora MUT 4182 TaxID=1051891 RepID=A0A0C3PXR6_9AGAM|nr:hypothetical protein M407DRAFT_221921 [Tulasnella calospora MUT 4182]